MTKRESYLPFLATGVAFPSARYQNAEECLKAFHIDNPPASLNRLKGIILMLVRKDSDYAAAVPDFLTKHESLILHHGDNPNFEIIVLQPSARAAQAVSSFQDTAEKEVSPGRASGLYQDIMSALGTAADRNLPM